MAEDTVRGETESRGTGESAVGGCPTPADRNGRGHGGSGASGSSGAAEGGGRPAAGSADRGERSADAAGRPVGSRRFPRVTRDTARPEGGGRAAPADAPAPARQWPLLTVVGATGIGLLALAFGAARVGTLIVGLALVMGAVLRRMLPSVGMLAVRSRFTDMVTYGTLGAVIMLLTLMAQPEPWLELPWLADLFHFLVR